MQGTLDAPPVVIAQDQGKLIFALFLMAGFVMAFVALGWGADADELAWILMGFALGGAGAWAFMRKFVGPSSLTFDQNGLTWSGLWTTNHFDWNAIAEFVVCRPVLLSPQPGCVFKDSTERRPMTRILGGDGNSFGPCWEMKAQEIVDLLNAARARWLEP